MTPEDKTKLDSIGALALSTRPTLDFSFELAEKCIKEGVPGDFVECGVYAGSQCAAMAYACQKHGNKCKNCKYWSEYIRDSKRSPDAVWSGGCKRSGPGRSIDGVAIWPISQSNESCGDGDFRYDRKIHLFDSFDGIPDAGHLDDPKLSRQSKCTLEQCFGYMTETWEIEAERLVFHPGWFEDTIPCVNIKRIAILRLDGDLYESTKTAIDGLFPFVVDGGYCIVDDYALNGCRLAVRGYFAEHNLDYEIHRIEGGSGPVWFRKEGT